LPEISLPVAQINNIPVGLSFAAAHYQDEFLLQAVQLLAPKILLTESDF